MELERAIDKVGYFVLNYVVYLDEWHEIVRLAKLGAAVEAMPEASGLQKRGSGFSEPWLYEYISADGTKVHAVEAPYPAEALGAMEVNETK